MQYKRSGEKALKVHELKAYRSTFVLDFDKIVAISEPGLSWSQHFFQSAMCKIKASIWFCLHAVSSVSKFCLEQTWIIIFRWWKNYPTFHHTHKKTNLNMVKFAITLATSCNRFIVSIRCSTLMVHIRFFIIVPSIYLS